VFSSVFPLNFFFKLKTGFWHYFNKIGIAEKFSSAPAARAVINWNEKRCLFLAKRILFYL